MFSEKLSNVNHDCKFVRKHDKQILVEVLTYFDISKKKVP